MKRISWIVLSPLVVHGLLACSTLSTDRTADQRPSGRWDNDTKIETGSRAPASVDDDGSNFGRTLSTNERDQFETRWELRQLEDQLKTPQEIQQYNRTKPYLNSERSRVEFLRQGTYEAKERWALAQGIYTTENDSSLVKAGETLKAGMTRAQVQEILGEPDLKEVAGNPRYGNERWRYANSEATSRGYRDQTYFIYFESGRVVGWQSL